MKGSKFGTTSWFGDGAFKLDKHGTPKLLPTAGYAEQELGEQGNSQYESTVTDVGLVLARDELVEALTRNVAAAVRGEMGEETQQVVEMIVDALCGCGLVRRCEVSEEEWGSVIDVVCNLCGVCEPDEDCKLEVGIGSALSVLRLRLAGG